MTATQTAFQALFASFAGLAVVGSNKEGEETNYTIARLDTKLGKMKDGTEAEYVVLQRADNEAIVVSLHPNVAKKLFKTGEANSYKIKSVSAAEIIAAEAEQAALQAELDAAQGEATGEAVADEGAKPETVVEETKEVKVTAKERAQAIFNEVVGAGPVAKEHRAPVIARFKAELGMGAPGASTYYQNCKKAFAA